MDPKEFNRQYDALLVGPLLRIGFPKHERLSDIKNETVLALLRFQMKFSGATQRTHFLVCVPHTFLRTLEKELPKSFCLRRTSIHSSFQYRRCPKTC